MDDALVPGRLSVPSLSALAAFEAAARHGSFTRAAEELNLTQGAVSRQVAHLEKVLGVSLFERVKKRVSLTAAGAAYANDIRDGLSRLAAATVSAMAFRGAAGVLNLATLPTFGTRWLIRACRASPRRILVSPSISPRGWCPSISPASRSMPPCISVPRTGRARGSIA